MWINSIHLPKLPNLRTLRQPAKPAFPRYRSYGRARIEIASQIKNQEDWDLLWKKPIHPYAFDWGLSWKQCIEYKVPDFLSEVGFFCDVLGLPVNAIGPDYVQFTSPDNEFYLAIVPAAPGYPPTQPDAIRIQFNITDFEPTIEELRRRGINFEGTPGPYQDGSGLSLATFRTPNGIGVEIFSEDIAIDTLP